MTKPASIILTVLLIAALGVAIYPWQQARALQREIDAVRTENDHAKQKLLENTSALENTRKELDALRRENEQLAHAQKKVAAEPVTGALRLIETPTNAGRASPEAAFETFYWAMNAGDMRALADVVVYDASATDIMKRMYTALSPEAQSFFGSPDVMMGAIAATISHGPAPKLQIVETKPRGADEVVVNYLRGDDSKVRPLPMRRTDDGWRVVGQGAMLADPDRQAQMAAMAEKIAAKMKR
jgi:hypothetical protein